MQEKKDNDVTSNKIGKTCECSTKYENLLREVHTRLEEEHKADKAKALKEFSDKVCNLMFNFCPFHHFLLKI